MPIYEYDCRDCGHRYDHLWRRTPEDGEAVPSCPKCGGGNGARRMSRLADCSGGGGGNGADACESGSGFG